jgi:hypothetical protein
MCLQHAHRDRASKRREVWQSRSVVAVKEEIQQTRSLCFLCHARETKSEERGIGEQLYPARERRRAVVMTHLLDKYDGRCQFGDCTFQISLASDAAMRRCLHWDHQPSDDERNSERKVERIAELVRVGSDEALIAELQKCRPVCDAHHRLVTRFRLRPTFATYRVERGAPVPVAMAEAAAATVENPDAWWIE